MHAIAASKTTCAKSAAEYPCVSPATCSRSTSSASAICCTRFERMCTRPFVSGVAMATSMSNRPKRRSAGSIVLGRLVAPITITRSSGPSSSMSVSSCETIRFSVSPCVLSRAGAIASSSSMKRMAGAFSRHSSKALRRLASLSPACFDITSGPLIWKVYTPDSASTALAIIVFPQPGAPWMSRPRGGCAPTSAKSFGWRMGSSTISRIWRSCASQPPMSSYPTTSASSSSVRSSGSPSTSSTVSGVTVQ
mmetsp:Transcript_39804/g.98395  ORF Transcript_39804/g.98395 Transcript_39804/m.98395 type:complete len:250 (-) Transcript_39804:694-1443(-)